MTRIRMKPDGTRDILSLSHFGPGDANAAMREQVARIEELNRQARAEWESLTEEERERRTREFHQREAQHERNMRELFARLDNAE
jgi:thiamine pyrophosphate-dependent acetolactate synthase large subunit-like protein